MLTAVTPGFAAGAEPHAPPMLTPLVAQQVARVCPGTAAYAEALVHGISESQAALAAPVFEKCAASWRHDHDDTSRQTASTAVGATYLSRALLTHDPLFFQRAIDATDEVRRSSRLSEEVVRSWPVIPDFVGSVRREAVISLDCDFSLVPDATYIYVAARTGTAWITQPREAIACPAQSRYRSVAGESTSFVRPFSGGDSTARRDPAIEPGLNDPLRPAPGN